MPDTHTLQQWQANLSAKRHAITAPARTNNRNMTDAERRAHSDVTAQIDQLDAELERRDIAPTRGGRPNAEQERANQRQRSGQDNPGAQAIHRAHGGLEVNEPRTYQKGNGRSYFQDLARHHRGLDDTGDAIARLRRHAQESGLERRDMDTTDGNGGYFVPPAWLVDQFVPKARAGRAYADLCTQLALPAGTNSINIPKVATGTATGIQAADNTAVTEQDMDDTSIEAKVRTIAGQTDVAIQLLDQSPVNFDQVIFQDLIADFSSKLDLQVLVGGGTNGQVLGVHGTPGIGTIEVPTVSVGAFYAAIADGIQRVSTSRFLPPEHIVMHPRRWAWMTAELGDDGRPLVLPAANGTNGVATLDAVASQQVVGQLQGLPVVTDPNIGTTYGEGTNEDLVYVQRSSDLLLFESGIRSRVLPDVGSGTLTVRLQVYGYIAFTAERYPQSIVEITGLTAPTF
ncbi:phage major capsid protein [Mycobacterium sp. NAZ190054]|uniref:phage major capsid protein n=1 Tax=Mycobacterium sp. NAZ190054 TaxID=1747766 RepID=UPI000AF3148E|nr:phage major capsid protein [Mycobacterium sp. NAZ190054]